MMTLREARLRRLLTVRDLARQAGVATATITGIEHGRVRPQISTMRKLAGALGVEPGEIAEFARAIEADLEGRRGLGRI
jgi:transcriptional regulator with XRE-family HTH domain